MSAGVIAAWAAVAITVVALLGSLGGVMYRIGSRLGAIEGTLTGINNGISELRAWLTKLSDGKGPVCARHEERLDGIDRDLEDHGRHIVTLEQRSGTRSGTK